MEQEAFKKLSNRFTVFNEDIEKGTINAFLKLDQMLWIMELKIA